ncbi:hypothetical protein [Salana multivorans]
MTDREEYGESSDALERELLERLRAADPAAGVEPSAGFVASVLARMDLEAAEGGVAPDVESPAGAGVAAARIADTSGTESAESIGQAPSDLAAARSARQDEQAPRQRRRSRPWLAGAAAAVVVGLAGFGAGSIAASGGFSMGGGDAAGAADSAPQSEAQEAAGEERYSAAEDSQYPGPIDLSKQEGGGASTDGSFLGGGEGRGGAASYDSVSPWFYGNREFTVTAPLSNQAGTATLYGLDPHRATEATVLQLADHFGVEGTSRLQWGAWTIGPEDGNGPTASVSLDGVAALSYYNWSIEPFQRCWTEPPSTEYDEAAPEWREFEAQQQACHAEVVAGTPPAEDARRELTDLLAALRLNPADYELTDQDSADSGIAYARATRIVNGQRTNVTFELGLAPEGITSVWGSLADVTVLRDVAVVSETEAFERMSDPRYGLTQSGGSYPYADTAVDDYEEPTQAPPAPSGSAEIEWPLDQVELHLGPPRPRPALPVGRIGPAAAGLRVHRLRRRHLVRRRRRGRGPLVRPVLTPASNTRPHPGRLVNGDPGACAPGPRPHQRVR